MNIMKFKASIPSIATIDWQTGGHDSRSEVLHLQVGAQILHLTTSRNPAHHCSIISWLRPVSAEYCAQTGEIVNGYVEQKSFWAPISSLEVVNG